MRPVSAWSVVVLLALAGAAAAQGIAGSRVGGLMFPPHVPTRIHPVADTDWSVEQRNLVARYSPDAAPTNDLRTLLVHPALVAGVMPFTNYMRGASLLPPRDRELLILRTAWLTASEYVWAAHTGPAAQAGLSSAAIARVGEGPDAAGWSPHESALLHAADELHAASFVTDETWRALATTYDTRRLIDAVFTVAHYGMLSMIANSLGTPLDAPATVLPSRAARRPAGSRTHTPLTTPRVAALEPAEWTPEVRALLDPADAGRPVAAVYRTYAQHPALYAPRQVLSEYIRLGSTLSARTREFLILRIGYLCGSDYEWAAHARAGRRAGLSDEEVRRLAIPGTGGWSAEDTALVRAVDEIWTDGVSTETWGRLSAHLDERQLLDLLITTGGYRMVSMSLNTFGVPLEPDGERIPR